MKNYLSFLFLLIIGTSSLAQTTKSINVTTSGSLSTLLTSTEKGSITNLTITGNIDAQDVKCLRDELLVLENLDIQNVSVKAYSGNNGTISSSTIYPENILPPYSFFSASGVSKNSLKSITLPGTLTSIGALAFYNCDGLTNLNVPNSVSTIGNSAFQMCDGLTEVNIGTGISILGDQSFYDCKKLRVVSIGANTPPTYGGYAFRYSNLSIVYVPGASLSLYKSTANWKDLPLASNDVITVNNTTAGGITAALNAAGVTSLSSVSRLVVTGILNSTDFDVIRNNMPLLIELDLSGAALIGNELPANALQNKSTLRKLKLPSTIVSIGTYALSYCTNLTDVLPLPASLTTIDSYAFWRCQSLNGELVLPGTLTTINNSAFNSCSSLTGSLSIPNSVTTLGASAFEGCIGLNGTLTLPSSLTVIQNGTFAGCANLNGTITIPQSVTSIANSAFFDCKSISGLEIGSNCSSIGDEAFQNALNLNRITVTNPLPPTITASTFGAVPVTTCSVFVPSQSVSNYKTANYWSSFSNISPISVNGTYNVNIEVGAGGTVSVNSLNYGNGAMLYVEKDATATFNITPNSGYEIATLMFNGIDVLSQVSNGQYTSPAVTANTTFTVTFRKVTYKIFVSINSGGLVKENNVTLSTDTELITDKNASRIFTIIPSEGYILDTLQFGGVDVKPQLINNSQYNTGSIIRNDTIKVRFALSSITYGITVKIGTNGSVKENNINLVNDDIVVAKINGTKTFSFIPSSGYELATVTYGGLDVKSQVINNQFTTQTIKSDAVLSVTFVKITYNITVQTVLGGEVKENNVSLSNGSVLPVDLNATKTFTFIPAAGYELGALTYGGVDVKSQVVNNQFTTPAVTANAILNVTFKKLTFNITVQIGSGGTIKENNINLTNGSVISADINTTKTFTFLPSPGYELSTVSYGGVDVISQISNNQFTTPVITANAVLSVTYRLIAATEKFGLTFQISEGGKVTSGSLLITNNSTLDLNKGSVQTFTFTPDAGYEINTVTYDGVNGKSQITNNQFTIPPINANTTLIVTYRLIPTVKNYDITIQIGLGGSVKENNQILANNSVLNAEEGSVKTFTFIPDQGYVVATLLFAGVDLMSQLNNNTYTTTQINSNAILNVTFKKIQYNLTIKDASSKGTLNLFVNYGDTPSFSITPESGWKVNTVLYNSVDVTANLLEGVYTLPPVTANSLLNISYVNLTASPVIGISNVKVYTNHSDIVIEGISANEPISVYTVNGARVYNLKSSGDRTVIPTRPNAVYLVKTAGMTYKVIL